MAITLPTIERARISARIRVRAGQADYVDATVNRIGPLGVEFCNFHNDQNFQLGCEVDVEIADAGETTRFGGFIIAIDQFSPEDRNLAVRFLAEPSTDDDRRGGTRWICPTMYLPVAMAPTPGRFNEFVRFQVRNISKDGLELHTDLKVANLLKGMMLKLTISLPLIGDTSVIVKAVRIDVTSNAGNEILSIGGSFVEIDLQARDLLAQYLLQFSTMDSPDDMRVSNNAFVPVDRDLTFSYIRSESDYKELLELRRNSESSQNYPSHLLDIYSRLALAKRGDVVVASVRVSFPDHFSSSTAARGALDVLPRQDQLVELTDIIAAEKLKDPRPVLELLAFVLCTNLSGQRPYVTCHAGEEYAALMKKIGMKQIELQDTDIPIFFGHPIDSVSGTGAHPFYWNLAWGKVAKYLEETHAVVPAGVTRVMLKIYRMLGPITLFQSRVLTLKKIQNHKSEK